ncbi:MAG: NYN domain-containing protein [Patescibacteria group bacterium]|nr:NYN domain-containing protein [Patescibacteria group bacterium]
MPGFQDKTNSGGVSKGHSVYVFIDSSNIWAAQKSKVKLLDYKKVAEHIKREYKADRLRVFYYAAYPAEGTRKYSLDSKHKFFTFLKKGLGFFVIKKELKTIGVISEDGEATEEKGNMDVEIAIDAMHHLGKYDTAILFSGDSDFLALVTYLRNHGKKVFVFSSRNNISEELRTGADGYTDILGIEEIWGKELKHRAEFEKGE